MHRVWAWLAALVLLIAGATASLLLGHGFFARIVELGRHLQSSDWNVTGGDRTLDAALRSQHPGQQEDWPIHLLAGSGDAFPLGDDARRDTVSDLADHAPAPGPAYARSAMTIGQAYAILVAAAARDRSIPLTTRKAAVARLAPFVRGIDDFLSFPTDTNPSADAMSLWDQAAVILPQSSKCRGTVQSKWRAATSPAPGAAPVGPIPAAITIMQRYTVLEIVRPWLDPTLLRAAARSPNVAINSFFKPGGGLAEVPSALVAIMPDQVLVSPDGPVARSSLRTLVASGQCCHVQCLGAEFDLDDGAGWTSAGDLNSRRKYPRPALYAVIAHREPAL